jgi:hypothetical protein
MRPGCEGESAAGLQLLSAQIFCSSLTRPTVFVTVQSGGGFGLGVSRESGIMPAMPDTTDDTVEIVEATGGQTVLVVDDMSDNLILISLSLQDMGYRVVTATNGADALNVAKLARPTSS